MAHLFVLPDRNQNMLSEELNDKSQWKEKGDEDESTAIQVYTTQPQVPGAERLRSQRLLSCIETYHHR